MSDDIIRMITDTVTDTNAAITEHRTLGAKAEHMRIRMKIRPNIDTIVEYNERIKGIANELVGDQYHTLLHITEMIDICAASSQEAVGEPTFTTVYMKEKNK